MKKLIIFITVLCLTLCACGTDPQTDPTETTAAAEPGFTFVYNGTEITMNTDAAPIVAALGEPISCTEQASCAFSGLDKTYFYGSFYMDTYPLEDQDYVYSLWFADDTVTTAEGLYIGAPQSQVESIYGTEGFNGSNAWELTKGASKLTILIEDGVVTNIIYDALLS